MSRYYVICNSLMETYATTSGDYVTKMEAKGFKKIGSFSGKFIWHTFKTIPKNIIKIDQRER